VTFHLLLWIAGAVGLYMAWNIGANDVANAMGTSVGSRALSMRQAVVLAGILEFAGAVLVGAYVTDTVRKGIVDPTIFAGEPHLLAYGMTAALASAALWLNVATMLGWPVSTTHSIVGAVAGFGVVVGGFGAISWGTLGAVVASWVVSPLTGGLCGYSIYMLVRKRVIEKPDPGLEDALADEHVDAVPA
jgi:phosphate/sulfate permease